MNKWIGSDKPKKDDFNSDNQKIDEVLGLIAQSIEQLESAQDDGSYASEESLATHADNSEIHVTAEEKAAWSTTADSSEHTANSEVHVTEEEKNAWNDKVDSATLTAHTDDRVIHITSTDRIIWNSSSGFVQGYYDGNGASTQTINLSYKPKFGIIFPVDSSIVGFSPTASQVQINSGFMSTYGCSRGIELHSGGFIVTHSTMGGVDNSSLRFNTSGVRYLFFLWRTV